MSTADRPDALLRRLDRLVTDSAEEPDAVAALGEAVESRLAVLEDALDGLSERIEALARDGAGTTTERLHELTAAVRRLDQRTVDESTLGERLTEVLRGRDEVLRQDLLGALEVARTQAAADRAAVTELAETVQGLREEVRAGTSAQTTALAEVARVHGRLVGVVQDMRAEWPTRTYEVVEGARAVAEAVVRDVRAEVQAQLALVREELARAADEVHGAADRLSAGDPAAASRTAAVREARERREQAERPPVQPPSTARGSLATPVPPAKRPAATVSPAPARRASGADRRGRLDTMPEVPSVQVALDAAAPPEVDPRSAGAEADEPGVLGRNRHV